MTTLQDSSVNNDAARLSSSEDEFGYDDYAATLAQTLKITEPPFCLGVFGGWGQGKTSLMRMIETHLRREEKDQHNTQESPLIIWFDAWKYDKEQTVWRALLAQTINDLEEQLKAAIQKNNNNKEAIAQLIKGELEPLKNQLYRSFSRTEKGSLQFDWSEAVKQTVLFSLKEGLPGGQFVAWAAKKATPYLVRGKTKITLLSKVLKITPALVVTI